MILFRSMRGTWRGGAWRGVSLLYAANGLAAALYIALSVARHAPLDAFPAGWRKAIIRWRRAHAGRAITSERVNAKDSVRCSPYDKAAGDAKFKAWPALNDNFIMCQAAGVTRRQRLELKAPCDALFAGDTLKCRLARAIADARIIDRKEWFETWEFFEQARGVWQQSRNLVEVAGGHGLLSILAAVFERSITRVVVADIKRPASHHKILAAAASVAPWVSDRVHFVEIDFFAADQAINLLGEACAIACVHGCNTLTDKVLACAIAGKAESVVVMPCCYQHAEAAEAAPAALRREMGVAIAADVQRTYDLEAAGYDVSWRHIPRLITPMNRLLVARQRHPPAPSHKAACRPDLAHTKT